MSIAINTIEKHKKKIQRSEKNEKSSAICFVYFSIDC